LNCKRAPPKGLPVAALVAKQKETLTAGALRDARKEVLPAKNRRTALHFSNNFIEEMKHSGFVAEALARHRIQGAVVAALSNR